MTELYAAASCEASLIVNAISWPLSPPNETMTSRCAARIDEIRDFLLDIESVPFHIGWPFDPAMIKAMTRYGLGTLLHATLVLLVSQYGAKNFDKNCPLGEAKAPTTGPDELVPLVEDFRWTNKNTKLNTNMHDHAAAKMYNNITAKYKQIFCSGI